MCPVQVFRLGEKGHRGCWGWRWWGEGLQLGREVIQPLLAPKTPSSTCGRS